MSIVGYLIKPEPEARKAKDGQQALIICSEYYRDVDDYDPVLRAHCRLSDEPRLGTAEHE
jgi:glutamine synthetase type III